MTKKNEKESGFPIDTFGNDNSTVIPVPFFCHPRPDRGSTLFKDPWIPAFAGMTKWSGFPIDTFGNEEKDTYDNNR